MWLDQRPDLERLLNSTIEFVTVKYSFRGVQPKLVFGPRISFFPIIWAAICQKP
jgi:hypothetical protein